MSKEYKIHYCIYSKKDCLKCEYAGDCEDEYKDENEEETEVC